MAPGQTRRSLGMGFRIMNRLTFACVSLALVLAGRAWSDDDGIPLAVTTLAHPSLYTTPTTGELAQSDRYLASGLAFLQKKVPARAVEELKDSVRIAPRAENFKALGTAYYEVGDPRKAAWAYRESLQLRPRRLACRRWWMPWKARTIPRSASPPSTTSCVTRSWWTRAPAMKRLGAGTRLCGTSCRSLGCASGSWKPGGRLSAWLPALTGD